MKRTIPAVGLAAALALTLTACGGDTTDETPSTGDGGTTEEMGDEPVTLSLAGWSLSTTPEFQALADAFNEEHPNVTVELAEYSAGDDYDTQMIADLAGGTAPDIYVQKNLRNFYTYADGQQLLDVSDVAAGLDPATGGVDFYEMDGASYAVPYRQDAWLLFYNKDLFAEAGIDEPDGSWTWDDYVDTAKELSDELDAKGTYQHSWQSVVQGFALAQSEGAALDTGDYSWLAPYYERSLDLQESGAQESFGTVTTNSLSYQAQFGTQEAAMLPMGSWYVATLIAQQESGEADEFEWGMAPIPQADASTTGTDATPVTFGDPTGLGINPAIDEDKISAAKEFLSFAAGEGGADALAGIGITPALLSDTVVDTYFALDGVPTDDLSAFAFSTHDTRPENPVSETTAVVQNILGDAHSAIMSESDSIEDALAEASDRAANEAGIG
ncbi:extracellular solute-binding protein [Isoptericola halotolerans]|uniref:Multiple sugar transport system substrate-binding protein n=1 Tax=Isoptericola halotolerans TaxID=300560 RepID=A0ABX2A9V8_9MICO|nr:extracellular solute-binding protein [Isoptericola halotolerans]NOV98578.1 multiple sugar transport system substrate-binding protein [Isoptericola halotolerans]